MNLFWSLLALTIIIAYSILPRDHVITPNLNFYYGPAGLVREGMATLRKVTMKNYPFCNATHPPTNFAINNTIAQFNNSNEINQQIAQNIKMFPFPEFKAFNECS